MRLSSRAVRVIGADVRGAARYTRCISARAASARSAEAAAQLAAARDRLTDLAPKAPVDADVDPSALLGDQRMRRSLVDAINKLPEREQHVMSMYYEHDMNLKEIAAVLGVTESRVCQLHSQSIARLRTRMREW